MILLIKTGVQTHVGTLFFKQILLYNQLQAGSQGKPHCFLLIRSIQMHFIQFEAFKHDFIERHKVLIYIDTVLFKQILLYNWLHSWCHLKNLCFLLIRSIQIYTIQFEISEHDFVDKEWCFG